jgi:HEAT repeat protein
MIEQLGSDDANERAKALAALVMQGRAATPALIEALRSDDERVRAQAAQGLSEIADPESADALAAAGDDEAARGYAAVGLARIGDPRALDALVGTIDDLEDPLHFPYTAAVYALEALGQAAVPAVVPLLDAENPNTRQRAQLVLRSAVPGSEDWDAARWAAWVSGS